MKMKNTTANYIILIVVVVFVAILLVFLRTKNSKLVSSNIRKSLLSFKVTLRFSLIAATAFIRIFTVQLNGLKN
jgi:hypothetical protein